MTRFEALLEELREAHPQDCYVDELSDSTRVSSQARAQVRAYSRALDKIDDKSWETLKAKAVLAFKANSSDRGKSAFFDQLNEAFAYCHLIRKRHTNVSFVPESKKIKTADLSFLNGGNLHMCEVKTIHISQEMIARYKSAHTYDGYIHEKLSDQFLKKLKTTLDIAFCQVSANEATGMAYLVLHFDDFTLRHYATYRTQILDLLQAHFNENEVYIRVGVQGRINIQHVPTGKDHERIKL
jgi:hypothetical protein